MIRASESNRQRFRFQAVGIQMSILVQFEIRWQNSIVSNCFNLFLIEFDQFLIKIDLFSIKRSKKVNLKIKKVNLYWHFDIFQSLSIIIDLFLNFSIEIGHKKKLILLQRLIWIPRIWIENQIKIKYEYIFFLNLA